MPGTLVHVAAAITCFHGAPATVVSAEKVLVSGQPVATSISQITVAACPLQVPTPGGPKPQPCLTIKLVPATRVLVNGQPVLLSMPGAGACLPAEPIPQGVPNVTTQTIVIGI